MDSYITPKDLGLFLIFVVVITLGVLFCVAIVKLITLIKKITEVLDTNRPQIDSTLKVLPETLSSVNQAASEISGTVSKAGGIIDHFESATSDVAVSVEETVEQVIYVIKSAISAFTVAKDLFAKK